jgi:hypothetical protein
MQAFLKKHIDAATAAIANAKHTQAYFEGCLEALQLVAAELAKQSGANAVRDAARDASEADKPSS